MHRSDSDSNAGPSDVGSLVDASFLHQMIHDLRAPVRHVRFFSSHLEDSLTHLVKQGEVPADAIESLEVLGRAGQVMSDLLNQLGELIVASSNATESSPEELGHVVNDAWAKARESHPDLDATLIQNRPSPKTVPVVAWTKMLECLFDNCLRNARADVSLQVTVATDERRLTVADNGIGLDPMLWNRALRPFERLRSTPTMRPGLGLTIADQIARRHGCELKLVPDESAATCIAIVFPA